MAVGVDDLGRIVMEECQGIGSAIAVVSPPCTAANLMYLRWFGGKTSGSSLAGISRLGSWIAGSATLKGASVGAYWDVF